MTFLRLSNHGGRTVTVPTLVGSRPGRLAQWSHPVEADYFRATVTAKLTANPRDNRRPRRIALDGYTHFDLRRWGRR